MEKLKYKFLKKKNPPSTSEFWYDISAGGYLKPEDFSKDKVTIQAIKDAIKLLEKCEQMCEIE